MRRILQTSLWLLLIPSIASADTFGTGENQFDIDFVNISGATNPTSGYGIVNNDYRMGTCEITNEQWNKFKAAYGAVFGNETYAYDQDSRWTGTSVPANQVSWYEAAQFVNWLNVSTGHSAAYKFTGTQGTSDYTFGIWDTEDAWGGTNLYRHKDAYYFLPTEDEWAKAAYWNGTSLQTYANASPADLVSASPRPDVPNPAKWNYFRSSIREPWAVGSGLEEVNGTYDMMGNVWEWMENPYYSGNYLPDADRGFRGGSYGSPEIYLDSSFRRYIYAFDEGISTGFRVASIPEPATILFLSLGVPMLSRMRQKPPRTCLAVAL